MRGLIREKHDERKRKKTEVGASDARVNNLVAT